MSVPVPMTSHERSEEHTSELQSHSDLVCRLLLDPPSTAIYTLSLHDALPISAVGLARHGQGDGPARVPDVGPAQVLAADLPRQQARAAYREQHALARDHGVNVSACPDDLPREIGRAHV